MQTCIKCKKLYAETFDSCPHCSARGKISGAVLGIAIFVGLGWILLSSTDLSHSKSGQPETEEPQAKWETVSGVQQGVFLNTDIDVSSIQRAPDGSSASVLVRLEPDKIERVTYICGARDGSDPGAVIYNSQVTKLPSGSTSSATMRRICFEQLPHSDSQTPGPNVTAPSNPVADAMTTLIPSCPQSGEVDCSNDIYQRVWRRLEADNGEVTKVDTKSIEHFNNGAAEVAVYTYVPDTPFEPSKLRRLLFDCAGQYRDETDGFSPAMDAPLQSIAGKIAAIACAGAKDTTVGNADIDTGAGESPSEYCAGFSPEACDRIITTIKSRAVPSYCQPGFAIAGSPQSQGLTAEQIRTCYLMTGDFSKLSTTR